MDKSVVFIKINTKFVDDFNRNKAMENYATNIMMNTENFEPVLVTDNAFAFVCTTSPFKLIDIIRKGIRKADEYTVLDINGVHYSTHRGMQTWDQRVRPLENPHAD